ncbi:MAG TPA: polysaccharide pyruvyl transferase family protein [Allosphingosinicella sp.]
MAYRQEEGATTGLEGMRSGGRIGILTFHRCINYGSYWQARCLVQGLRARGHDAVLLDHDCPEINRVEWRCAFQPLLPHRTRRADFPLYARKARKLLSAAASLPLSPRFPLDRPEDAGSYDLIIVGSDEVWNMRHPWYGGKPIFYGVGLRARRFASYAASFGNHNAAEDLGGWWADRLRGFSAISVRDENSRIMVRHALNIEPELVLDPCLQFPPALAAPEPDDAAPYVAIYGHGFPAWYEEAVRYFARRRGYRLLSIGYRNDWADAQHIDAGPEEFARLIAGSAAVATNFFHGCVFALLNGKPFACASSFYRANKVRDLMHTVGSDAHLAGEEDVGRIDALLDGPLDPAIASRIDGLRSRSSRYLDHVLG